jgi:CxxC-x17-CxxC domain-containing protein
MKKFDRGNRGDSDRNFRKGGFRNNDSRPMTMHSAICASCKKTCEVPFRPNGDKPVYCRDCFAGRAAMGGERSSRKDFRKESGQFNQNENKFTPRQNFNLNSSSNQSDKPMIEDLKKQIDSMNIKLDKLTNTIQNLAEKMNKETPKVNVEKENKVEVEEKPVIFSKVKKPKTKTVK